MELWIRSQDKEILIKVDRIGIGEFENGYGIVTYERIGTKNEFGLGLYTTKERALEVLDEIQRLLEPQEYNIKTDRGTYTKSKNILNYVYEMPED